MENIQPTDIKHSVIVLKQKSKTTAVLLALFFGPFGLLYTSFLAFLIMLIVVPIGSMILIALIGSIFGSSILGGLLISLVIIFLFYNLICAVVAYRICNKKNKNLYRIQNNEAKAEEENISLDISFINLISYFFMLLFIFCLLYMFYDKLIKLYL